MAGRGRGMTLPAWQTDPSLLQQNGVSNGGQGVSTGAQGGSGGGPSAQPTVDAASCWRAYTSDDGRPYYHNTQTDETTWEKPDALKSAAERALGQCAWAEYATDDGKTYYYNASTGVSEWVMPEEYAQYMRKKKEIEAAEAASSGASGMSSAPVAAPPTVPGGAAVTTGMPSATAITSAPTGVAPLDANMGGPGLPGAASVKQLLQSAKQSVNDPRPLPAMYHTQHPGRQEFFSLLYENRIEPFMRWEEAMKAVIADPRYKCLTSPAERKEAFAEFCRIREQEVEEERKRVEGKLRENFLAMLKEHKDIQPDPGLPNSMPSERVASSWRAALPLIENDPRFLGVPRPQQRELWFEEYLLKLESEAREKEAAVRKEHMEKFKEALEGDGNITASSQWRRVRLRYEDNESFQQLAPIDRLAVYEAVLKKKVREEEEAERMRALNQRKEQRANREAFRQLLRKKLEEGAFNIRTHWKEFLKTISENELYQKVRDQPGSAPHELYEDILEELENAYEPDRVAIKAAVKGLGLELEDIEAMSFEDFSAKVKENDTVASISSEHMQIYYEDVKDDLKYKRESEARKEAKRVQKFEDLLESGRVRPRITATTTWEEVREDIETHSAGRKLKNEAKKKELFEKYVEDLKTKRRDAGADESDEEGMIVEENDRSSAPRSSSRRDRDRGRDHHERDRRRDSRERKRYRDEDSDSEYRAKRRRKN